MILGDRNGVQLSLLLGLRTSAFPLLRGLHRIELPVIGLLRFVGINDVAFRKGHPYRPVIVNLETHRSVEVFPERTTAFVEAWLKQPGEITLVTRPPSSEVACAITAALPKAIQVLDQWHLLNNLREVLERFLGLCCLNRVGVG